MIKMMKRDKTENLNLYIIHIDISAVKVSAIEQCPYDTSPSVMKECVNDELDDDIKNNLIEENETKVNFELGYDTGFNHKEVYQSTETEISTSEEVHEKHKRGKMSLLKNMH